MTQPRPDSELVEAYLQFCAEHDDSLFWAYSQLTDYLLNDSSRAWQITLQLIEAAPSADVLSQIGAGPLEDLLYGCTEHRFEEVERLARQNSRFRLALQSVYNQSETPGDIHDRVAKLQRELLTCVGADRDR